MCSGQRGQSLPDAQEGSSQSFCKAASKTSTGMLHQSSRQGLTGLLMPCCLVVRNLLWGLRQRVFLQGWGLTGAEGLKTMRSGHFHFLCSGQGLEFMAGGQSCHFLCRPHPTAHYLLGCRY